MSHHKHIPWRLWLAVLALHALALAGLNTVLTLNRLAAQPDQFVDVVILQSDEGKEGAVPKPKVQPQKATPAQKPLAEPLPAAPPSTESTKPADESSAAPVPAPAPVTPAANSLPEAVGAAALETPATAPPPQPPPMPASQVLEGLKAAPPSSVLLRYILTKGNDSAKASLNWQQTKSTETSAARPYELSYEATYFGVSIIKQTSLGALSASGLLPARFGDKRRGKPEQAAHFLGEKSLITFSNNRPDAKLRAGTQDRASYLIQLASLFAGQPELLKTGQVLELPVAGADELEIWSFEIQTSEAMHLPIGPLDAIKLLRRPRKAFDQTIEVWLAPKYDYLPVRIRYTDSTGAADSQLASKE